MINFLRQNAFLFRGGHNWDRIASVVVKNSLVIAAILHFNFLSTRAQAAMITLTDFGDSGPGTLRTALASAADGDTIVIPGGLSPAITLKNGELLIAKNVTIVGPGPGQMAVSGNHASRIFHVGPTHIVTIAGLTITQGAVSTSYPATNAGALFNDHGTLTVSNCTISGNSSGGVYNKGAPDGGTFGSATLVIVNSSISGNSNIGNYLNGLAGGVTSLSGQGGPATVTISNCTISGNSGALVGGVSNGDPGFGNATMQISSTTINGNSGGGIANTTGEAGTANLTLGGCTLSGNFSDTTGAAIYNYGTDLSSVTLRINNCTISGNSTYQAGVLYTYASGQGTVTTKISNSTFSGNVVTNQAGGYTGIIYNDVTGGGTARVQIGNTILDVGGSGKSLFNYTNGTITSFGYNLSSDAAGGNAATGSGGLLNAVGDLRNTDPRLGPLQDNGGPTATHALLSGSSALDKGKRNTIAELATTTDQRGLPRPFVNPGIPSAPGGDGSDIGAYELNPPLLNLVHQANEFLFFWPRNNGGFQIQSSTNLVSSNDWATAAGVLTTVGEWYYFTNAIPPGNTFYRLVLTP